MDNKKYIGWLFGYLALSLVVPAAIAQETVTVPIQVVSYADMIVYDGKVMTMDWIAARTTWTNQEVEGQSNFHN